MRIYLVYLTGEVIDVVVADWALVVERYPDYDVQIWYEGRCIGEVLGKDLRASIISLFNMSHLTS